MVLAAAACGMALALGAAPAAQASHDDFFIGTQFRVGGVQLALVFDGPGYGRQDRYDRYGGYDRYDRGGGYERYDRGPAYWYRLSRPLPSYGHGGHRCTSACFHRGGQHYHAPSCPLIHGFLSRHHVHPSHYWPASYPVPNWRAYDNYYDWDWDRSAYDRYDRRGDRYGHDDRYRDDDRHRGRGHYRGRGRGHDRHRHDAYCRHDDD
jgi:hypothetical protein